jgi:hypothetical protein
MVSFPSNACVGSKIMFKPNLSSDFGVGNQTQKTLLETFGNQTLVTQKIDSSPLTSSQNKGSFGFQAWIHLILIIKPK